MTSKAPERIWAWLSEDGHTGQMQQVWSGDNEPYALPATEYVRAVKWQPIETAPKDGSDILIWQPKGEECFVVYWDDVENGWRFSPRHVLADSPTHWMPLPNPPEESK